MYHIPSSSHELAAGFTIGVEGSEATSAETPAGETWDEQGDQNEKNVCTCCLIE